MLATEGGKPFTHEQWIYGVKYDGYRCLARAGGGDPTELRTRMRRQSSTVSCAVAMALAPGETKKNVLTHLAEQRR